MSARRWLSIAVLLVFPACGGSEQAPPEGGPADAGSDADGDAQAPFEPLPPVPPALPVMTPCPEGWREVPDSTAPGLVRCDPWPVTGRQVCAADEAHFPGEPGCALVGTPCDPDDDFATDLPGDAEVIYVMAGRAGGNGLRSNPFGDLQEAIDVAVARGDAIVALSKGTFDGAFTIYEPVTLWGACTAQTILTRTETVENGSVVEINDEGAVTIRNLRFEADQAGIYVWEAIAPVIVDSVIIQGRYAGVYLDLGSTLEATNLVVTDTATSEGGRAGHGMYVAGGAHASVTRGTFERNHTTGVAVIDEGSELVLRDTAILDTLTEQSSGYGGAGVQARLGARATLERVVVADAHAGGAVAQDPGSVLTATDLVVRDVLPANGVGGHGLVVWEGAQLTGRRIDVARSSQTAVTTQFAEARLDLEDLVVLDTQSVGLSAEYADGVGIGVGGDSVATLRRALLARSIEAAIAVDSDAASLLGEDITVIDTEPGDGPLGLAVAVTAGAEADFTRLHATGSAGGGVQILGTLRLSDALVERTAAIGVNRFDGWGLVVAASGSVEAERVVVRGQHVMGLGVAGGARFVGRDIQILDTRSVLEVAAGIIAAGDGSSIELTSFRVGAAEVCGLLIGAGSSIDLHDGEVRDNPIGVNVQDPDFEISRLQDRVRYIDNGTNLDTSHLPLPAFDTGR